MKADPPSDDAERTRAALTPSTRPWRVEWVHAEARLPNGSGWYVFDERGAAVAFAYRGADAAAIVVSVNGNRGLP